MSRNLCTDRCCGVIVRLEDLAGKPLEFRKYHDYRPVVGTKWTCPKCNKVYFVIIRTRDTVWGEDLKDQFDHDKIAFCHGRHVHDNHNKGKFAKRYKDGQVHELGSYEFDLSYYESFNDEGEGVESEDPQYLCVEDDEKTRCYLD